MAHFEQIIHDWITDLMISCVLSYVMHLDPQLVREEVKTEAQLVKSIIMCKIPGSYFAVIEVRPL